MNLKDKVAYVKERDRINTEVAAYTDACRNKNRFTEYYKLRIAYLECLLTELESKHASTFSNNGSNSGSFLRVNTGG